MDEQGTAPDRANPRRRKMGMIGLVASGLVAGGILAGSQVASAASSSSNPSSGSSSTAAAAAPANMDPAKVAHGPGETLLTGTTASKIRAAALAKVPGATVIRVETDSQGAAYEAHLQKSDGSYVTVKLDKNFQVTDTISGFGAGPAHNGSSGSGA